MAARYVYSGAAGAGTGADWANAHTTLAAAITASTAGDIFYVAHDHNEGTAGTLTFKGTDAAPDRIYCVDRAGTVPPVAADLRTTGLIDGTSNVTVNGVIAICYGLAFHAGVGSAATLNLTLADTSHTQYYKSCHFKMASTSNNSRIRPGLRTTSKIRWDDCSVEFSGTGQGFNTAGDLRWFNKPGATAIVGATLPTNLLIGTTEAVTNWVLSGLDLSVLGSGKTLVANGATIGRHADFINCNLGSSVTVAATPTARSRRGADLIGCDSTAAVARNERYRYEGTLTTETTVVRTGGASDGTTPYSWKVVTTANSLREDPFECFEGAIWNEDIAVSKTLTVHIVSSASRTDAGIWLEVDYLSSATVPVVTTITDAPATVLTAGAAQAASTESWASPPATPAYQKLEVTFTPAMVGPIRWRVKVGEASATVYICPKPEIA